MRAFTYDLPLTAPLWQKSGHLHRRQGLLLESNGNWSEAAPLPGFSRETLDDVINALRGDSPAPPSLRFAIESLELPTYEHQIPVNALLQGSPEQLLLRSREISESACRCVKLKVGRIEWQDEAALVCQVREQLRPDQLLRLDANRAWSWDTGTRFAQAIAGLNIEFIEEPLQDPQRLEEFAVQTGLSYALDETLLESESIDAFGRATAFVVKPTLIGSVARIRDLARLGKPMVFSACYESGVGLSRIAQLASELGPNQTAGFDTYSHLAEDVLKQRLEVHDWQMHFPGHLDVNANRIEKVDF